MCSTVCVYSSRAVLGALATKWARNVPSGRGAEVRARLLRVRGATRRAQGILRDLKIGATAIVPGACEPEKRHVVRDQLLAWYR